MGLYPNTAKENEKLKLSRALDAPGVSIPANHGKSYFPFQKVFIPYSRLAPNVLLADPPGVGKTIQVIGAMNFDAVDSALIVAPASLLLNWRREIAAWSTRLERIEIYHPKTFNPLDPPDVLLMSYHFTSDADSVKRILSWGKWARIVLDECHYLKNPASKRTKYTLAKNGLISTGAPCFALSGTPIVNRPMELWPIIKALAPQSVGHMTKFEYGLYFCGGKKLPWGWDFTGATNIKQLGQCLRSHFMIRRMKSEVLPQLPPRYTPNVVYADPNAPAKDALSRIETYDVETLKDRTASAKFEEMSRARRELGLSKVPFTVKYIKDLLDGGHDKILLFAHHKEVIADLAKSFQAVGVKCLTYSGGMSAAEKDRRVNEFQNSSAVKIFIVSLQAGGVGLTLTRSSYVVFAEYSWVPGENEQAIDRAHRIGQASGVCIDYIVYEGTLDERILKKSWVKNEILKNTMEA